MNAISSTNVSPLVNKSPELVPAFSELPSGSSIDTYEGPEASFQMEVRQGVVKGAFMLDTPRVAQVTTRTLCQVIQYSALLLRQAAVDACRDLRQGVSDTMPEVPAIAQWWPFRWFVPVLKPATHS